MNYAYFKFNDLMQPLVALIDMILYTATHLLKTFNALLI